MSESPSLESLLKLECKLSVGIVFLSNILLDCLFSCSHVPKHRHYFANKVSSSQGYGFSCGHVWMWELDCEESWALKNWCFWTVVLEKTLESPLDCKEIQTVHSEGDEPWDFFGRNDAKAETPVLWPPHAKSWLIGKDSDAGRDWAQEEKGMTEDEMAGWHHWLDGRESEWTPWIGDGQGGLACCDSRGRKESDTTERLNWTELICRIIKIKQDTIFSIKWEKLFIIPFKNNTTLDCQRYQETDLLASIWTRSVCVCVCSVVSNSLWPHGP